MKKILKIISYTLVSILIGITAVYAGSLTPPGSPENTMYSLTDIYNLSLGTTTTLGSGTIEETPGSVSSTGKTLEEVYQAISTQLSNLSSEIIAKDLSVFGQTGSLYGDTDPSKVMNTATYAGTANPGDLTKTGQTTCWDDWGSSIECLGSGQDGAYLEGLMMSFNDNGNGTVSDNITGLMWQQCSNGLSGADCSSGSILALDWLTAISTCEADTTAGYTDWRLPNIKELFSIVKFSTPVAIDTSFFPNTTSTKYWSSTNYQVTGNEGLAWYVIFESGSINSDSKDSLHNFRCVR